MTRKGDGRVRRLGRKEDPHTMVERTVVYFERPGKGNTEETIRAVRAYVTAGHEVEALVVASMTGQTAAKAKHALGDLAVPVVCVTGPPGWQVLPGYQFPLIPPERRRELEEAGVTIVDCVPSTLSDTIEFSYARYGFRSPTWMVVETLLAIGGYGLKTAVECAVMATDGSFVAPFREIVAMAGTDTGADTAVVMRSTFSSTIFSSDRQEQDLLQSRRPRGRRVADPGGEKPGRGRSVTEERHGGGDVDVGRGVRASLPSPATGADATGERSRAARRAGESR